MRKPVIAGNWKLFKTTVEALELIHNFAPLVKDITDVEVVVAPGFTVLGTVKATLAGSAIQLAAQDCFWEQ
jgi:triosephosphate isomerase